MKADLGYPFQDLSWKYRACRPKIGIDFIFSYPDNFRRNTGGVVGFYPGSAEDVEKKGGDDKLIARILYAVGYRKGTKERG